MKKFFIVANWKSNKASGEINSWFQEISNLIRHDQISNIQRREIVICPSFPYLQLVHELIQKNQLSFKIGAQNISPFREGSYTGEVNTKQIKDLVKYVIVGHSERRNMFGEDNETINRKINQTIAAGLIPILCISDLSQIKDHIITVKSSKFAIAYEPLFAIGSGKADTPGNANKIATEIKKELGDIPVLYGGSVTSQNIKDFTSMESIDGALVGGSSLDPEEFSKIVEYA